MTMTKRIAFAAFAGLVVASFAAMPASAATSKQKQDTCKFGADHQKLTGAKRKAFMTKCLSSKNDPTGPAQGASQGAAAPAAAPISDDKK
ncbi:MAG: PsiF family protein [Xanthobacteraceae bacterium]